ncbi:IS110 family transposase [Mariniflexile gromovii]|uniref:Transposase n=1 Tax=Mariniflexile gromovii TaxID=362523 RepID=A0ABS4BSM8_9FLAO|nr:transposase [Mariniflexile gromovii]MBP0903057.1 transposase [Mariniflexile gromovii]
MKNYLFHVGIDISKLKLDVVLVDRTTNTLEVHFVVPNNTKGLKRMLSVLKQRKVDLQRTLYCFENTGVYTFPLSCFCFENGFDYWIVPAVEIKRSKGITRGKSDKSEAKDIAYYSIRNIDKLQLSSVPEQSVQQLKLLFAEREKIKKSLLLFGSTKENSGYVPLDVYRTVEAQNKKTIKFLKASLAVIDAKMRELVKRQPKLKRQFELIKSIKGVGDNTAIYFIIATKGFEVFASARKLACYAGVAPFEYSSGSSIRGGTKVNHMADKTMKSLLQMCALSAVRHDAQLKAYYLRKQGEGKNKMLVLNNVRCKIIGRIFAVINRDSPFVDTCKFVA